MKELIYKKDLLGKTAIGLSNGKIWIKECEHFEADKLVKKYHYSHKTTKNRFKSFLVNDGLGVLQLGYGIRPNIKKHIHPLIDKNNYCEFDRMWLSDELPKFSESQTISLLLSYLKQIYKNIKFVITYADESVGNKGTIYKATNAIILKPIKCDFYVLSSGERVHPVSMYHKHKTRAIEFLKNIYPGIKHICGEYKQFRFLYILDKKIKKSNSLLLN